MPNYKQPLEFICEGSSLPPSVMLNLPLTSTILRNNRPIRFVSIQLLCHAEGNIIPNATCAKHLNVLDIFINTICGQVEYFLLITNDKLLIIQKNKVGYFQRLVLLV